MKNLTKTILAVLATGVISCALFSQQAQAQQISGNITFTGVIHTDTGFANNSNAVTEWGFFAIGSTLFGSPLVNSADGNFSLAAGTFATFSTPWVYTSATPALWSVLGGSGVPGGFTFDLFAGATVTRTATSVTVEGFGVIHGFGFEDTLGTWSFTTQDPGTGPGQTVFSFSAAGGAVPDGGSTVAFLGLVLAGVEGLRRKLKRTNPAKP